MQRLNPICEAKRCREDGTTFVYFPFYHDGDHKVFLNTQIAIPPEYWNKRTRSVKENLPSNHGDPQKLNDEIERLEKLACEFIKLARQQGIQPLGQYIKETFTPTLNLEKLFGDQLQRHATYIPEKKKTEEDFFNQIADYIKSKERKVKPATLQVFRSMQRHLEAFEVHSKQPITFAALDFQFYEQFVDFLTFDYELPRKKIPQYGVRVNTIGKTIHQFRIFILDRVRRKIIPKIDLHDFKVPTEETDAIYLTFDEIGKIYVADLTDHPELMPARDLFVLGCLTGLRFSDFSALHPEDLRQNMLYKKQEKSVHWVVIPLRKEAKEIFTEQFKEAIPGICNAQFNKKVKEIAKLAGLHETIKFSYRKGNKQIEVKRPKWAWVTSHTARRSFCTNEYLKGTPYKMIMQISGHKREKDFYKYIRIDPEAAAQKVMELWLERGDYEVFKNPRNQIINLQQ